MRAATIDNTTADCTRKPCNTIIAIFKLPWGILRVADGGRSNRACRIFSTVSDFGAFVGKKGKGYSLGKAAAPSGQNGQQAVATMEPGSLGAGQIGARGVGRYRGKQDLWRGGSEIVQTACPRRLGGRHGQTKCQQANRYDPEPIFGGGP